VKATRLPRLAALLASAQLSVAAYAAAEDASVAARLDARGIAYEIDDDGDYKVTVSFEKEKRTQLVFVSGRTETVRGLRIREVFAPAGRVKEDGIDGERALALLASSQTNKLGSWELAGNTLYLVIKLPDDVSAADLEAAIDVAAQTADDMEIELSGDADAL
jgi:hypothetical protein